MSARIVLVVTWILSGLAVAACLPVPAPAGLASQPGGRTAGGTAQAAAPGERSDSTRLSEVFERVAPSVAFVETPIGSSGSGVLISGGYLVTNAHVIYPFEQVRVVFPDGAGHAEAPVVGWDLLADLAVIGPLETEVPPLGLADGEGLPVGSQVALIGYPGEVDDYPLPALTRGVISRLREWAPFGLTFFQTDALTTGGQSGGALVSSDGQVIGISGLRWPGSLEFALAASAADLQPRIEALIAAADGFGARRLPREQGGTSQVVMVKHRWDMPAFLLDEPAGTAIEIHLDSTADISYQVVTQFGEWACWAEHSWGKPVSCYMDARLDGPYILELRQSSDTPAEVQLSSTARLIPCPDPDDGQPIRAGQVITASIDYPGDIDTFVLDLARGETVALAADSMLLDPLLTVTHLEASDAEIASDDDSAGGISGTAAGLTYRAPRRGKYLVVVENYAKEGYPNATTGGYLLSVAPAADQAAAGGEEEPFPAADETLPRLATYASSRYPFDMQVPADWTELPAGANATATFADAAGGSLRIQEEDVLAWGMGLMSPQQYVDIHLSHLEATVGDVQVMHRTPLATDSGDQGELVVYGDLGGARTLALFCFLREGRQGFRATYAASSEQFDALFPLIMASFASFRVTAGR